LLNNLWINCFYDRATIVLSGQLKRCSRREHHKIRKRRCRTAVYGCGRGHGSGDGGQHNRFPGGGPDHRGGGTEYGSGGCGLRGRLRRSRGGAARQRPGSPTGGAGVGGNNNDALKKPSKNKSNYLDIQFKVWYYIFELNTRT